MNVCVFVGPYVEVLSPVGDFDHLFRSDVPEAEVERLFASAGLAWNRGSGDPRTVEIDGQSIWQRCGVPVEERSGCPRRGMYSQLVYPGSGDGVVTEWDGAIRSAEVAWFRAAFAEELSLLERVLGKPPRVRWGLVWWVT